jgi:hypothetical protein
VISQGVNLISAALAARFRLPAIYPFRHFINLKAAKALGLGLPRSLLVEADEVIH